jgi:hypothetical protein
VRIAALRKHAIEWWNRQIVSSHGGSFPYLARYMYTYIQLELAPSPMTLPTTGIRVFTAGLLGSRVSERGKEGFSMESNLGPYDQLVRIVIGVAIGQYFLMQPHQGWLMSNRAKSDADRPNRQPSP